MRKQINGIFKLPRWWEEELKEIIAKEGVDYAIEQICQWIENNNLIIDNGSAKPL